MAGGGGHGMENPPIQLGVAATAAVAGRPTAATGTGGHRTDSLLVGWLVCSWGMWENI